MAGNEIRRRLAPVLAELGAVHPVLRRTIADLLLNPNPSAAPQSPLDVGHVDVRPSADEVIRAVREGRERSVRDE